MKTPSEKSTDTTEDLHYCKCCFQKIKSSQIRNIIEKDVFICDDCLNKINPNIRREKIDNTPVYFLCDHTSILNRWLRDYKDNSDFELCRSFLYFFKPFIKLLSLNSIIVPTPVLQKSVDKNEYNYINMMLESINIKYCDILLREKTNSFLSNNSDSVSIKDNGCDISNKKIIFFQDVLENDDFFFKCIDILKKSTKRKVIGLVLIDLRNVKKGIYE